MATPQPAASFLWERVGTDDPFPPDFSQDFGPQFHLGVSATTLLTTELNSLGTSAGGNVLSTLGAAFQNTDSRIYCDVELLFGATVTTVTGGFAELWFLRSLDGTNYELGSATQAPARWADLIIPVPVGTGISPRCTTSMAVLPPSFFKPILRNRVTTLPSSGNQVSFAIYSSSY